MIRTTALLAALLSLPFGQTAFAWQVPEGPRQRDRPSPRTAGHDAREKAGGDESFHWRPALEQSGLFLAVQHSSRLLQDKTRRELGGPFFADYFESASNIHTWSDQDGIATNYVGHPIIGAMAGYIQIFNDPAGRRLEFDPSSGAYWKSRLKALAWSAAYSTQFEIGPFSEASIGNVGKTPPTMAMVDLVVTPTGGLGLIVLEDYLDQHLIRRLEQGGGFKARLFRVILNPSRALTNVLRWKLPSYRDNRPLPRRR